MVYFLLYFFVRVTFFYVVFCTLSFFFYFLINFYFLFFFFFLILYCFFFYSLLFFFCNFFFFICFIFRVIIFRVVLGSPQNWAENTKSPHKCNLPTINIILQSDTCVTADESRDCPGGPVTKTLHFQCKELGFNP